MIIIGIDPGSVVTGYAVIKKDHNKHFKLVDFGCIMAGDYQGTGAKLKKIHAEIIKLIEKHKPALLSVENLFFFKNLKTAMPVSQTRGVILLAAEQKKLPVLEFTPLQMKMAICGYGRAEKRQVQEMIKKTICLDGFDLKKKYRKKDDAFDAIGMAICAAAKAY